MKLILGFFCFIVLFIGNINSNVKAEILNNETLKIGLIVPLSGEYKKIGESIVNSTRLAINKINTPFVNNKVVKLIEIKEKVNLLKQDPQFFSQLLNHIKLKHIYQILNLYTELKKE